MNLVTQCNGAFFSNYNNGGNLGRLRGGCGTIGGCLNAQGPFPFQPE